MIQIDLVKMDTTDVMRVKDLSVDVCMSPTETTVAPTTAGKFLRHILKIPLALESRVRLCLTVSALFSAPTCTYGEYTDCHCTPTCADIRMDIACAQWTPNADANGKRPWTQAFVPGIPLHSARCLDPPEGSAPNALDQRVMCELFLTGKCCACPEGYAYDDNGVCVPESECSCLDHSTGEKHPVSCPFAPLRSGGVSPFPPLRSGGASPFPQLRSGGSCPFPPLRSGGVSPCPPLRSGGTCLGLNFLMIPLADSNFHLFLLFRQECRPIHCCLLQLFTAFTGTLDGCTAECFFVAGCVKDCQKICDLTCTEVTSKVQLLQKLFKTEP